MILRDKLHPGHTALIVVDMQNDFCSHNGLMATKLGKDISKMDTLVSSIQKCVSACESYGIPVIFTQHLYDRSKLSSLQKEQYDLDDKLAICHVGSYGSKFYGFTPTKEQIYLKYVFNIFSNVYLHKDLQSKNIKTLIITGVSTHACVETAVRIGFDLGYKIIVPADATSTTSHDTIAKERTLHLVRKTYGVVSTTDKIIALLQTYKQR